MATKRATDILEHEHHYIQKAVRVMTLLAEALEAEKNIEVEILHGLIEFMRSFGDACHHGKEEDCLFPLLEKKGVPKHGCPIGALRHEHETGRALVKELAENAEAYARGDRKAKPGLTRNLRALAELYPSHIWKEDYLLFPMTNKILSSKDQQVLLRQFEKAEQKMGEKTHRHFERLIGKLEQSSERL